MNDNDLTPEQLATKNQIHLAGARAKTVEERHNAVDWNKAPPWATTYYTTRLRRDQNSWWVSTDESRMATAPDFFPLPLYESIRIPRRRGRD